MKNVVSVEWLVKNLDKENLCIVDCRFDMSQPGYGKEAYEKSHIQNASFVSLEEDLAGKVEKHGGRHPLPKVATFAKKMEDLNMKDESIVVIYDDGDLAAAARLWWMLKYIGKETVYVLEGGFKEWIEKGFETTEKVSIPLKSSELSIDVKSKMISDVEFVRVNIGKEKAIIIDSRAKERYLGLTETIDAKGGHIEGAENYFWRDNFQKNNFKSLEELKERFKLLEDMNPVIVHCGSGITACPNILAMDEVGLEPTLYLGGWSDWISYEENQIVSEKIK